MRPPRPTAPARERPTPRHPVRPRQAPKGHPPRRARPIRTLHPLDTPAAATGGPAQRPGPRYGRARSDANTGVSEHPAMREQLAVCGRSLHRRAQRPRPPPVESPELIAGPRSHRGWRSPPPRQGIHTANRRGLSDGRSRFCRVLSLAQCSGSCQDGRLPGGSMSCEPARQLQTLPGETAETIHVEAGAVTPFGPIHAVKPS